MAPRIDARVLRGRSSTDRSRLADALGAEWIDDRWRLARKQLEARQLGGCDDRVVDERAGDGVAVAVIDDLLKQRLRHALGDAAVSLPLRQHRAQHRARVVYGHVPDQARLAGLGVHLGDSQVGSERERRLALGIVHVRGQASLPGMRTNLSPGPTPRRIAAYLPDPAVDVELEVGLAGLQHV